MTADPTKAIAHARLPRWKKVGGGRTVQLRPAHPRRLGLPDVLACAKSRRATPMATARYTVQLMAYAETLRLATQILASHGHPAARSQLADAALDFRSAEHLLSPARDVLLRAAGADRVTDHD